jgi:hypothetical protein
MKNVCVIFMIRGYISSCIWTTLDLKAVYNCQQTLWDELWEIVLTVKDLHAFSNFQ